MHLRRLWFDIVSELFVLIVDGQNDHPDQHCPDRQEDIQQPNGTKRKLDQDG